ncbi:hypothetical protein IFU01_18370 [Oxalobacteraceae sp. CFBP 8763]|nr:hypothetical protein [Oxalobacteraceae sp. CFBP 8763]
MSFQRRIEMDSWFSHLQKDGSLEYIFDSYYLCLMVGFSCLRDDAFSNGEEITRRFPTVYLPTSRLIIGLLLIAETEKLGKKLTNKGDVEFLVNQYLNPDDAGGNLNEAGFDRLNRYANGGLNYMIETLGDRPYHFDSFLSWYSNEIRTLTQGNDLWNSQTPKVL